MKTTFHFTKQYCKQNNCLSLGTIFSIVFFGIILLPVQGMAQEQVLQVRVIISEASVRSGAGINHLVVVTLAQGTVLPVLSTEGDWYRVRLSPEFGTQMHEGFIHNSVVEQTGPLQIATPVEAEIRETRFSPISDTPQLTDPVQTRIGLVPISPGQSALSISLGFPNESTIYGVQYSYNLSPMILTGFFKYHDVDFSDVSGSITFFGGEVIYDLTQRMSSFSDGLSLFLTGELMYGQSKEYSYKINFLGISAGGGISNTFDLGAGNGLLLIPYATLAIYYRRVTIDLFNEARTDTDPDFILGAMFLFDRFYAGIDFQNLIRDTHLYDSSFLTLRFGLLF